MGVGSGCRVLTTRPGYNPATPDRSRIFGEMLGRGGGPGRLMASAGIEKGGLRTIWPSHDRGCRKIKIAARNGRMVEFRETDEGRELTVVESHPGGVNRGIERE